MTKIGIYFGTNSGTTRLIAKKLAKRFGADHVIKPLNINRVLPEELLQHRALILGTPTYSEGRLPSAELGANGGSWQEFLPQIADAKVTDTTIALFGCGDQTKHGAHFADAMGTLRDFFAERGATIVGHTNTEGYQFEASRAVEGDKFCGLVIDNTNQPLLTEQRLEDWVTEIAPLLLAAAEAA